MKVFCLFMFAMLAACVSPPSSENGYATRIAEDVAVSVRQLAEAQTRYGDNHPEVIRLKAAQASLSASGAGAGASFGIALVDALNYELAAANKRRAEMALRYGDAHSDMRKCDAVIAALTEALREASLAGA